MSSHYSFATLIGKTYLEQHLSSELKKRKRTKLRWIELLHPKKNTDTVCLWLATSWLDIQCLTPTAARSVPVITTLWMCDLRLVTSMQRTDRAMPGCAHNTNSSSNPIFNYFGPFLDSAYTNLNKMRSFLLHKPNS